MADYERGLSNLRNLAAWASENAPEKARNEADTRFHLIDRLLLDCLGWDPENIQTEHRLGNTITDYELGDPSTEMVLEAKREGTYFELPAGFEKPTCPISVLEEASPEIKAAIRQVLDYAQSRGVPVAAICNGEQVIVFVASRVDGVPPLKGRAIVFTSLNDMEGRFRELWNAVSRPGLAARQIHRMLAIDRSLPPPEKLSTRLVDYPGYKNRNPLQLSCKSSAVCSWRMF